jgi:CubicO group peptidase (beta-lactamase class C family)
LNDAITDLLDAAVVRQDLPFAVAMVANRDGVVWQTAVGDARPGVPATMDTMFRLFSATKAIGAACALILVERGQLSMDTPVAEVLPEFDQVRVRVSTGDGEPSFRAPRRPCTLRHLLTHTNGSDYAVCGPGGSITSGTLASLYYPMTFDPGESFAYGIGVDWAGLMVQQIDGRSIDQFCREEILDPLGMVDTMFEPDGHRSRLAVARSRSTDGTLVEDDELFPAAHPELYGMGGALYGTAPDFVRFLRMVLNRGALDGARILGCHGVELMLTNQIGDVSVPIMKADAADDAPDVDFFPETRPRMTWTAAFLRNEADVHRRRAAGSLTWAGFLNTHYWVDPANDIAAVLMTQSLPFCDPRFVETYIRYERAVYAAFAP